MSGQLSLFETRAPPKPEPPPRQRFQVPLEVRKVKSPLGKPDKRGKYEYEKLHEELMKLPEPVREHFNYVTIELPEAVGKQYLKCFRMFMGFGNDDLMDFDESRGRL